MRKQKKNKAASRLGEIIQASDTAVLRQLVERLASARPDVRRECLEFLQQHAVLVSPARADAEAEVVFALWQELEPDLAELDEYGGGDHDTVDHVGELLYELFTKLEKSHLTRDDRRSLLDEVLGSYAIPLVAVARRRASTIQFRHSKQEEVLVSHAPHNGAKVLEFGIE